MKILVTGCYGFVGHHVTRRLMDAGHTVIGMDRLVDARSPKAERVTAAKALGMKFVEGSISSLTRCREVIVGARLDCIIHLAAQFPVKHSLQNVASYLDSNVKGFINIAEVATAAKVPRVIYASTVAVSDKGTPGSLYGATKMFNEHAAHVYSRLGPEMIGLRFGAVYGPMMREDAGIYRALLGQFTGTVNAGNVFASKRPIIYIDDAADLVRRFVEAKTLPARHSVHLSVADDWFADYGDVITAVAPYLGRPPIYPAGYEISERAGRPNLDSLDAFIGWRPFTSLDIGARPLAEWFIRHHQQRRAA